VAFEQCKIRIDELTEALIVGADVQVREATPHPDPETDCAELK
jgi:hypothetical protein